MLCAHLLTKLALKKLFEKVTLFCCVCGEASMVFLRAWVFAILLKKEVAKHMLSSLLFGCLSTFFSHRVRTRLESP